MEKSADHRPGDVILDHFVPHLAEADRELARKRLQGLAKLMLRYAMRKVREEQEQADSLESVSHGKITPVP